MKITAFNGAMRASKSISHLMLTHFLAGAAEAGAETEEVFLRRLELGHCKACLTCWIKTPGRCMQKDDGNLVCETYMAADVVIMATPLYVDNVSGVTKVFMDRLIPLVDPRFTLDADGESSHVKRYDRYPDIIAMSNCGYPEQSQFQVLRLLFRRIARNMSANLIAEIYRGGGGLLGLDQPMLKPFQDSYFALLRKAGGEVVRDGAIAADTQEELEQQMVPTEMYNAQINQLWDGLMSKAEAKEAAPQD